MIGKVHLYNQPVTILGGAGFLEVDLLECLSVAYPLIAADGGANYLNEKKA